ncbi:hypothetical protein LTR70_009104 [Exophiala xenobiotica]|uniref:Xylanolytic transcriptional activator regulatory domain-containing protein n=1 Tax=Lithohypha guttulata TaxID=1690604 RepID=A0ABR0JZW7_9EURO|nr:hypothetical protein LTR24_008796 [Lithohypha guttulata]KAK5310980.1 hypothetical protein LTR70_009104 [Exophiala xenobiotica]
MSPAPFSPPASNRDPLPRQNSVLESAEEANVDLLATETFEEGVESDVGYFGPSSNHAYFRALSDLFARILTLAPSTWPMRRTDPSKSASSEPLVGVASAAAGETESRRAPASLPHAEATQLVEYYFMSVGQMTPFLSKSSILSDLKREHLWNRTQTGVKRALLAIVYALATSSLHQSRSAEFYKDAVGYLGNGRLRGASLDLIQALMLTVTYQQNHQMSVTSWTYHALAVKTAFQLGLQSPLAYRQFGQQEKDLRLRLWYSLVTQDRILCMCLGRPCLIPAQYVRTPKPHAVENVPHNLSGAQFHLVHSHVHHDQLTSLYEIVASVLHRMYHDNIDINEPSGAEALISTRTTFQWQLEAWRRGVNPAYHIMTGDGLITGTASTDTERFRFVLSIHYYRAVLILNAPALLAVLRETMDITVADDWKALLEHAVPIVRHEFSALRDLHGIMSATLAKGRSFLDQNNAWWLCNYTFRVGVSTNEVRTLLEEGLNNMTTVQRNSVMTQKAHQVLMLVKIYHPEA